MQSVEKEVEVNVPIRAVYDQWTQFEDFLVYAAREVGHPDR